MSLKRSSMYGRFTARMWSVLVHLVPEGESYRQADVILTDRPEVTLFMRFADCVPILLHDPRRELSCSGACRLDGHDAWRGNGGHFSTPASFDPDPEYSEEAAKRSIREPAFCG